MLQNLGQNVCSGARYGHDCNVLRDGEIPTQGVTPCVIVSLQPVRRPRAIGSSELCSFCYSSNPPFFFYYATVM